ncbi:hypothetical protein G9A89_007041 [Geosiphon pyriformis]|nr:hypothetical protein G9A89_007041 [Geosiphon pyriformis]
MRVYNQQYTFYYTEVNNVWIRLKKDLRTIENEFINMPVAEARYEAITLEDDPEFIIEMKMPILKDVRLVPDFSTRLDSLETLSAGQVLSISNNTRLSEITLPELDLSAGGSSIFGLNGSANGGFDVMEDLLLVEDTGIDFDADGALHEYVLDQGQTPQNQETNQDRFARGTIDEMLRQVREEHYNAQEPEAKKLRREGEYGADIDAEIGQEEQSGLPINMDMEIVPEQVGAENSRGENYDIFHPSGHSPAQQNLRKRKHSSLVDDVTELTNQEILAMRDTCREDLIMSQRLAKTKTTSNEFREKVKELKTYLVKAPKLVYMWNRHCAPIMQERNLGPKTAYTALTGPSRDADATDVEESVVPVLERGAMFDDEPERRRAADSQRSSGFLPLDPFDYRASSLDGVPDSDRYDRASSTETRGSRDISLDLSGPRGSGRRRQSSFGFDRGSISSDGRDFFDEAAKLPEFALFDELQDDEGTSSESSSTQSPGKSKFEDKAHTEKESFNFMEIAKTSMKEAGVSRVSFQKIMQYRHAKQTEAAKSFYHVLVTTLWGYYARTYLSGASSGLHATEV